jgi:hypothetical protein
MTRDGTALLTADQRRWLDVQRKLKLVRPTKRTQRPQMNEYGGWLRRSSDRCRLWCFEMVRDKAGRFAQFITATLFLNFAVMLSEFQTYGRHDYSDGTWDMTNEPTQPVISASREYLYMLFTVIYVCEALIKLLGLGWRKWATSRYNLFDTCLLAILLPVMFVLLLAGNQSFSAARLEAVRLLQKVLLDLFILKLVQRIRILKMLFRTVAASFLSILNIIGVLLVVFSAYALMMVEVFGLTRHQLATSPHANFRSFGTALLTLFRMTTGETWNQIFHEIAVEWPNCVENPNTYLLTDCGSTTWSFVLVLSFEILITLFLMNLFVVSVIDNFDFSYQQDAVFSLVTMEDLNNYKQAWAEFDPNATGYIPRQELLKFLRKLGGNFEVKIYDDDVQLTNLLPKISSGGTVAPQRSRPNSTVGAVKDELQPHKFNNNIPVNISTNKRQSLSSTPPSTKVTSVDISKLNSALSGMDPKTTRRRRQLFNFIYQEAVSFEEPQRGIPFDKLLRVLAYKLVDAEQFLRIDQMFQRQHQMNRIQRLVYEEKVRSLLNTIVLRKRYRRLLASTHQQDPLVSTQQTVHSSRAPNPLLNRLKPGVVQGSNTSIDRHSRSQLNNFTAVGGMSLLGRPMASGVGGGRQQHVLGRRPQSSSYSVAKSATSLISAVDSDDSQSLSKVPLDDSTINQQQQTIWDNSDTTAMDAVCDNYWTDLL